MHMTSNPIYCAVDTPDLARAEGLANKLLGSVGGLKLGLEFFSSLGVDGVRRIADIGVPIFLDLKLHDIPNTVAKAVHALAPLNPAIMTIHTQGGRAMMAAAVEAAAEAADKLNVTPPKVVGVTVLTSLDDRDLLSMGVNSSAEEQVLRLAKLASESGLDGIVCSPHEVAQVRDLMGPDFHLVVPGIRPAGAALGDQKRVMSPHEAMTAGADVLVIGRPITGADDPAAMARHIAASL